MIGAAAAPACDKVKEIGQWNSAWDPFVALDYSSQQHIDLDQINTGNVGGLNAVCEAQPNEPSWFSSGMLMVGHTLYVATARTAVFTDYLNGHWPHA